MCIKYEVCCKLFLFVYIEFELILVMDFEGFLTVQ